MNGTQCLPNAEDAAVNFVSLSLLSESVYLCVHQSADNKLHLVPAGSRWTLCWSPASSCNAAHPHGATPVSESRLVSFDAPGSAPAASFAASADALITLVYHTRSCSGINAVSDRLHLH
jgi:hypothetical protein